MELNYWQDTLNWALNREQELITEIIRLEHELDYWANEFYHYYNLYAFAWSQRGAYENELNGFQARRVEIEYDISNYEWTMDWLYDEYDSITADTAYLEYELSILRPQLTQAQADLKQLESQSLCPFGYRAIPEDLTGAGKQIAQPHP